MGIVAYCPNGHRVKVKDELAGRKGICPQCAARFRVPRAGGAATLATGGHPVARVVSLDPAVAARLPRAFAIAVASGADVGEPQAEPTAAPREVMPQPDASEGRAADPVASETEAAVPSRHQFPSAPVLHPALAERPDLTWSVAVPGGQASAPMSADALQSFLDAGGLTGTELVWREDWADWAPIGLVFPERRP